VSKPLLSCLLCSSTIPSAKSKSWSVIADEDDYDAQEAQPASKKKTPKSAKKSVPMLRQVARYFINLHSLVLAVSDFRRLNVCACMALLFLLSKSRCQLWLDDDPEISPRPRRDEDNHAFCLSTV